MNIILNDQSNTDVIVGFSDKTHLWYLRWLARGFRHCFALIEQDQGWVLYDPLSNRSVIKLYEGMTREYLINWYVKKGYRLIDTEVGEEMPTKMAPIMPYSCVEAVKRLLGIHRRFLLTPKQLFLHISEQNRNKIVKRKR